MKRILIVTAVSIFAILSCKKECDHEEETKKGCTDTQAINYSAEAVEDDGSCTYQ